MNLTHIKQKAIEEYNSIDEHISVIQDTILKSPLGMDKSFPEYLIPKIEKYCDDNNIPFYHVAEDCCSIASTYAHLFVYESKR